MAPSCYATHGFRWRTAPDGTRATLATVRTGLQQAGLVAMPWAPARPGRGGRNRGRPRRRPPVPRPAPRRDPAAQRDHGGLAHVQVRVRPARRSAALRRRHGPRRPGRVRLRSVLAQGLDERAVAAEPTHGVVVGDRGDDQLIGAGGVAAAIEPAGDLAASWGVASTARRSVPALGGRARDLTKRLARYALGRPASPGPSGRAVSCPRTQCGRRRGPAGAAPPGRRTRRGRPG